MPPQICQNLCKSASQRVKITKMIHAFNHILKSTLVINICKYVNALSRYLPQIQKVKDVFGHVYLRQKEFNFVQNILVQAFLAHDGYWVMVKANY